MKIFNHAVQTKDAGQTNLSAHLQSERKRERHSVVWIVHGLAVRHVPALQFGCVIRVQRHDVEPVHHAGIILRAYELIARNVAHRFHAVKISVVHAQ